MMKALKISTDNKLSVVELSNPIHKSIHEALGGYFEIVRPRGLKAPYVMLVDEEGLIKELPLNFAGSVLYGGLTHGHSIAGDVLIMRDGINSDGERDLLGLSDIDIKKLSHSMSTIVDFLLAERR